MHKIFSNYRKKQKEREPKLSNGNCSVDNLTGTDTLSLTNIAGDKPGTDTEQVNSAMIPDVTIVTASQKPAIPRKKPALGKY